MAKRKTATRKKVSRSRALARSFRRWLWRAVFGLAALMLAWIVIYSVVPVPTTVYMLQERARLGPLQHEWAPIDDISPNLMRAAVAGEDANFCLHWGFDMTAIRDAIADGATRGGSTISQQTVKNAFLWHGRTWVRKAMEAAITPVMELLWSKRRILEIYLNVAEFAPGVFGAEAAAQHHFGVSAADLTERQASLLAAVLPNPQMRNASAPSDAVSARARSIAGGAATIRADGRDDCFAN